MSTPFLGQVSIFAFNFAPKGWALCNGQILSISQNQALFALLGTQYGGNGQTNFALPNLQGNVAMMFGNGFTQGQVGGEMNHTLIAAEIPAHKHPANYSATAASLTPGGGLWAPDPNGNVTFASSATEVLAPQAIGNNSGGQPHPNTQPYLVVNFCIALQGIFPSRN
jgi:microcystin-dependent protein